MAKKHKEFIAYGQMTKKAKLINFLKIFGIAFGAVVTLVAGITLYVFFTGGFNPPFVPLTTMTFSQSEYVIDKNKIIKLDENGNQIYDENGNIELVQSTDENGNPVYDYVMLVPNEGCTELDAFITLTDSSNLDHPVVQLVEDENVVAIGKTEDDEEGTIYKKYSVKINAPIHIKPTIITDGDKETTLSGWIRLEATHEMITTSCWVFVDTPVESLSISLRDSEDFDSENEMANGTEEVTFSVFPNSQLKILNTISPNQSQVLPSTNAPNSWKTSFNLDRKIQYQVSDTEIATIDANGNITINPNKEGQTFSVSAYVISRYKDVVSEEYSFNKNTCIISNTIKFKIKEISVSEITTLKQGASRVSYEYPVFQSGTIQYSNDSSKTVQQNDFYVDLVLTNNADESFKSELYNKIKIYVGVEGEIVSNQDEYDQLDDIRDLVINGHSIDDASQYFNFDAETKRYMVNQYSPSTFYFVFYYEMEDEILFDYIPFSITKVEVSNIELTIEAINLNYEKADGENRSQTYSLTNSNIATVTPSNSTYKQVLYFVDNTDQLVEAGSLSVKINGKDYYAVKYTNDEDYVDYGTIKPVYYGRTILYAVVVRTLPSSLFGEDDSSYTGQYAGQCEKLEIGGKAVYVLKNNDGVEFEYYSAPITLTISKDVQFTSVSQYEGTAEDIYNKSDKIVVCVTPNDAEKYAQYNTSNDIYAEINQGGELAIKIEHSGTPIDLEGDKLQIVYAQDANQSVASVSKINNTHSGVYYFSIMANQVGSTQFQIIYNGSKGQESVRTIGIKVLSTELVEIDLDSVQKTIEVEFVTEPVQSEYQDIESNATGFYWRSISLGLAFKSPDTEAKDFELVTYALPENFDTSILGKYQGKQFEEIIEDDALNNTNNSIQKLLAGLTISDSFIDIDNDYQRNPQNTNEPNKIYITVGNDTYAFSFTFKKLGNFLLFAQSTSTSICSNPVLVSITIPEITVEYGNPNETTKTIMAYGNKQDGGLISIDYYKNSTNNIEQFKTSSSKINLYLEGDEKILFTVETDNNKKINVSDLMKFRFERQIESAMGDKTFTSTRSGATITNKSTLTVYETSSEITENIAAYSDFGYFNQEFYTYNISPDYKLTTNTTETYLTPTYLDLFEGEKIIITNKQYSGALSAGNKLYLPVGYVSGIDEFKSKYKSKFDQELGEEVLEELFREKYKNFYYADATGESSYYHIYCNIITNETSMDDYIVNGQRIKLLYKQSEGTVFVYFSTPASFQLSSKINVAPGISSAFELGGGDIVAANWTANDPIDLSARFNFVQNTAYIKTEDEKIVDGKTYYVKSGNEYVKVDNPNQSQLELDIYFEQVDAFSVLVDSLSAHITSQTSDNLKFFNRNGDIVIVLFNPYEDYGYSLTPIFNKTTDENIVNGKTYYLENGIIVENPNDENIDMYYEIANHYFIKTQDVVLDPEKTYYKFENGDYEAVDESDLDIDEKDSYFEKVYSNNDYYKLVEAYYLPIDKDEAHENYKSKYYERATKYRKATGAFDAGKTYYVYENNKYIEVENASSELIDNYYEKYYEYSPVSTFVENKTYYYRYDYQKIESGDDITDAFRKISITVTKKSFEKTSDLALNSEKTYYKLNNGIFEVVENPDVAEIGDYYEKITPKFYVFASEGIEELSASINLILKLNLKITNKSNGCDVTYNNYTYTLRFIGI